MHLLLFRSLWTNGFDLPAALADCCSGPFDGIEGPLPPEAAARDAFIGELNAAGIPFIAELALGGGYVPSPAAGPAVQLEEFRRRAEEAAGCAPLLATVLAGADRWNLGEAVEFFGRLLDEAAAIGLPVSVETHRSRPTYSPWATGELLRQLPALRLTCDFSHWCCVCERLVLDEEPELLAQLASRARHVHARVGYDQGPQVPHPAAQDYARFLRAHEAWWDRIWAEQARAGQCRTTMTPEFGPDGYLQSDPFSGRPAADLDEINRWMASRQRSRFPAAQGAALAGLNFS